MALGDFMEPFKERGEGWEDVGTSFVSAKPFGAKSRDIEFIWNIRGSSHGEIFVDFLLQFFISVHCDILFD